MDMNATFEDNDLIELLQTADAGAAAPRLPLAEDIAAAARDASAARTRFNFAMAGSAMVLALVASVAFGVARSDLHRRNVADHDRARLRNELTLLNRQANANELSANLMSQTLQRRKQAQHARYSSRSRRRPSRS